MVRTLLSGIDCPARLAVGREELRNAMQIRIVLRWSPVRSNDALLKICNIFKQLPCRLGHHEEEIERSSGRLALRCVQLRMAINRLEPRSR